ncbi:SDR family NAD(P)-dependent oxidoreductase [Puniceicoccus vermicola]|uniref:SDR family NAD(P)-dependent oxidoreductase n=1 Tax=Puniceicoccus vermicola TaxID=388746 RepID=A0A7X1AYW5_9BACT|nr:SDR family NAD(P)-dependent oxidoreductase [Puniceicoccus vermicola]MBC2602462.1 SDR family NAD(P)-dependent oxidoreductase [Puniceicoccus vermicola]
MKKSVSNILLSVDRIVITGGSSGIGAALLQQLGTLSPDFKFCNLSRSSAENSSLSDRLISIPCDLSDEESSQRALEECREWLKREDRGGKILLINNSGFGGYGVFPAPSTERNLSMIDVNVAGPLRVTGFLAEELKKSKGAVINIASTASFQPTPYLSTYGATKAFLMHWSLGLAQEWKADGVQVLCVCPGPTETAFFKEAGFKDAPLKKGSGQTADEVAEITLKAFSKGKSLVTCGVANKIVAAAAGKLPKTWVTWIAATIMRRLRLERYQD